MVTRRLGDIAYARSGDKGSGANVGVIATSPAVYHFLREQLTAAVVETFFEKLGARGVKRYELPNLGALNFVLPQVLGRGGSLSLRSDAQGKALGQQLLEMTIDVPDDIGGPRG
jgi:hypothetical protein